MPINLTSFDYPDWLNPDFPMHQWCDSQDKVSLATLDVSNLRQAHYVEWFTKRDFYNGRRAPLSWSKAAPATGLYFDNDSPLVIYPNDKPE